MAWIRQAASKLAQSVSNPTVRYSGLAVLTAPEWRLRRNGISNAYDALSKLLNYVRSNYCKTVFYYEADIRNIGSMRLLQKFADKYEIIERELEEIVTDSGKELKLQGYVLKAK